MSPMLWGIALGAAGAFILDPQQGRRRRALLRDKWARGVHDSREFADAARRDLRQRADGARARLRTFGRSAGTSDEVLVARVRAKLGRHVSHPSAVEVVSHEGNVVLTGDVLAAEHDDLVSAVAAVHGVKDVADHLDVHAGAEGVSSLQGGAEPDGERAELLQDHWSPGIRALTGGASIALFIYGLARGGLGGLGAIILGSALLARTIGNQPMGEIMEEARERLEDRVTP